jgi:hypothetical protein
MKKITITVSVDGNEIYRDYSIEDKTDYMWGSEVLDMLDTLEKAKEVKF